MNETTKRCPYCGEEILAVAKKCRYCGEWLDESARPTTKVTPATNVNLTADAETIIRQTLAGKYEIISTIGKGGMATVYKARQVALDRIVALKVIHLNLIHDEEFLKRFRREAELGARLNHPNIVTTYDVGSEGSVNYMAMEYLEGEDLHQIIKKKGRLTVEETVSYISQIAEALDYAHREGLVHRDIKSGNIFITKEGRAVLTDFGIAHAASGTKLTKTGTVIGTPEYMSPEQADGREIDGRSDLYSLGVVMYECLTGSVPFRAENPMTVIFKIFNEEPPAIRNVLSDLPEWIEGVTFNLLAKEREKRIATGQELSNILRNANVTSQSNLSEYEMGKTIKIQSNGILNKEQTNVTPQLIEEDVSVDIPLEMVLIKGGEFFMGSKGLSAPDAEKPSHKVKLDAFYISKYPITQKQWEDIIGENPSSFKGSALPVENITWLEAADFCNRLSKKEGLTEFYYINGINITMNWSANGYRLPTEAEWEFAAIGGSFASYNKYSGGNVLDKVAWYKANSNGITHKVGLKRPNELALFDMSGNVWEWCNDWYSVDYYKASSVNNPKGPAKTFYRTIRGGSWKTDAEFCNVTTRNRFRPQDKSNEIGFRIARNVK